MQTNMHEAKSTLSQLAERASKGEKVIIAKAGKPFVQLVAYQQAGPREFGQFQGEFKMTEGFDDEVLNDEIADLFDGGS